MAQEPYDPKKSWKEKRYPAYSGEAGKSPSRLIVGDLHAASRSFKPGRADTPSGEAQPLSTSKISLETVLDRTITCGHILHQFRRIVSNVGLLITLVLVVRHDIQHLHPSSPEGPSTAVHQTRPAPGGAEAAPVPKKTLAPEKALAPAPIDSPHSHTATKEDPSPGAAAPSPPAARPWLTNLSDDIKTVNEILLQLMGTVLLLGWIAVLIALIIEHIRAVVGDETTTRSRPPPPTRA